jgi:biotin transport system substrate-specific component
MTRILPAQYQKPLFSDKIVSPLFQVIGGSLFIALCAQIKIPLAFSPVPLTLQTLAVMLVGATLGRRNGALTVLLYLAEISGGLPFLAGGLSAPLSLFGLKGGYYWGFIFQAYMAGWCRENQNKWSSPIILSILIFTTLIQLGIGTLWLSIFVGIKSCMQLGFYPFILGDILKCVAAFGFIRRGMACAPICKE